MSITYKWDIPKNNFESVTFFAVRSRKPAAWARFTPPQDRRWLANKGWQVETAGFLLFARGIKCRLLLVSFCFHWNFELCWPWLAYPILSCGGVNRALYCGTVYGSRNIRLEGSLRGRVKPNLKTPGASQQPSETVRAPGMSGITVCVDCHSQAFPALDVRS